MTGLTNRRHGFRLAERQRGRTQSPARQSGEQGKRPAKQYRGSPKDWGDLPRRGSTTRNPRTGSVRRRDPGWGRPPAQPAANPPRLLTFRRTSGPGGVRDRDLAASALGDVRSSKKLSGLSTESSLRPARYGQEVCPAYAAQFLGQVDKPTWDAIEGLSPADSRLTRKRQATTSDDHRSARSPSIGRDSCFAILFGAVERVSPFANHASRALDPRASGASMEMDRRDPWPCADWRALPCATHIAAAAPGSGAGGQRRAPTPS